MYPRPGLYRELSWTGPGPDLDPTLGGGYQKVAEIQYKISRLPRPELSSPPAAVTKNHQLQATDTRAELDPGRPLLGRPLLQCARVTASVKISRTPSAEPFQLLGGFRFSVWKK